MTAFEMPKTYDPSASERRIYDWWETVRLTSSRRSPAADAEPFVISIPPPNITGELHLGHAMFVSLEDLMIRYKRMRGYAALWVPGYDHAGIATQLQVEKMLRARRAPPAGRRPGGIPAPHLGVEREVRRPHRAAAAPPGRVVRLGPACASRWTRG